MQPLAFADLWSVGEWYERALLNLQRLELPDYQPPAAFRPADYDWPGDAEGRIILGLVLAAQSTHQEPRYLTAIINKYK